MHLLSVAKCAKLRKSAIEKRDPKKHLSLSVIEIHFSDEKQMKACKCTFMIDQSFTIDS